MTGERRNSDCKTVVAICAGLVLLVALIYGQTVRFGFVNYDDNYYVFENNHIRHGLSLAGIGWAWSHIHANNWHPLTTISHMLDWQFYQSRSGGHHLTNALFHAATSVLLFLVFRKLTGALWRSAFVAAIFAAHPLHVESVAWISERKDVLSAFFFVLTLGAYVRYVRRQTAASFLIVVLTFAAGLLCKPMLVTTPFVLLLLDYWPFQRFKSGRLAGKIITEKVPFLLLSAASCGITLFAQQKPLGSNSSLTLPWRMGNAVVSYAIYLRQTVWPVRLSAFYPIFPEELRPWQVVAAFLTLAVITTGVILLRRTRPYLITGWLWYLGMLVPVIGIAQVGAQAHADRYTYLPQIGLTLVGAWGGYDLAKRFQFQRLLPVVAAMVIAVLALLAWRQTATWKNGETLWQHALAVNFKNDLAHYGLGDIYVRRGEIDKGIEQFRESLKIRPDQANAEDYLGIVLMKAGHLDEALEHFEAALTIQPNHVNARFDFANGLFQKGDIDDAMRIYQNTLQNNRREAVSGFVQPDYAAAHYNLGNCYIQRGDWSRAITEFREALALLPESLQARNNLGFALSQSGKTREAIQQWEEALRSDPQNVEVLGNLAWVLATSSDSSVRNGKRAVELSEQAQRLSNNNPKLLRVLAAAHAAIGDFDRAVETAKQAEELANQQGDQDAAANLDSDLRLYLSKQALRN